MRGTNELAALARLLRVCAATARDIGSMRPRDQAKIGALSLRVERIADEMDELGVDRPNTSAALSMTMLQAETSA